MSLPTSSSADNSNRLTTLEVPEQPLRDQHYHSERAEIIESYRRELQGPRDEIKKMKDHPERYITKAAKKLAKEQMTVQGMAGGEIEKAFRERLWVYRSGVKEQAVDEFSDTLYGLERHVQERLDGLTVKINKLDSRPSFKTQQSLLTAPRELRDEVYRHLELHKESYIPLYHCHLPVASRLSPNAVDTETNGTLVTHTREKICFPSHARTRPKPKPVNNAAILRTCRTIHDEVLDFLYSAKIFVYTVTEHLNYRDNLPYTLRPMLNLSRIQRLEFDIARMDSDPTLPCSKYIQTMVWMLQEMPALKHLTLQIERARGFDSDDPDDCQMPEKYESWQELFISSRTLPDTIAASASLEEVRVRAINSGRVAPMAKYRSVRIGNFYSGNKRPAIFEMRDDFAPILQAITAAKGWVCDEERRPVPVGVVGYKIDNHWDKVRYNTEFWASDDKFEPERWGRGRELRTYGNEWLWRLGPDTGKIPKSPTIRLSGSALQDLIQKSSSRTRDVTDEIQLRNDAGF